MSLLFIVSCLVFTYLSSDTVPGFRQKSSNFPASSPSQTLLSSAVLPQSHVSSLPAAFFLLQQFGQTLPSLRFTLLPSPPPSLSPPSLKQTPLTGKLILESHRYPLLWHPDEQSTQTRTHTRTHTCKGIHMEGNTHESTHTHTHVWTRADRCTHAHSHRGRLRERRKGECVLLPWLKS